MLKYSLQSPGGEVVNAAVCKTAIRGFNSHPGLTSLKRFERFNDVSPGASCLGMMRVGVEQRSNVFFPPRKKTSELRPVVLMSVSELETTGQLPILANPDK